VIGSTETRLYAGFFAPARHALERLAAILFERRIRMRLTRCAMTPETEGKEEKGPSGLPFINDPGNEDPGSLMDDATVPLMEGEEELEYEDFDDDE